MMVNKINMLRRVSLTRTAWISGVALLLLSACSGKYERQFSLHERWAPYYDMKAGIQDLDNFDMLVLDSFVYPDLTPLKEQDITLLSYLSIGEVQAGIIKDSMPEEVIIEKNENWNSYKVDIRQPVWYEYIIDQAVPVIISKGFDGVMLDTIDSSLRLEEENPEKYKGMRDAAKYIIATIRHKHPNLKIMLNRAFSLLPEVESHIDMILAEGTLSHYDLEKKEATHQPDEVYMQYVEKIHQAQQRTPRLKVYSLDYWDMNDKKGVTHIYRTQRLHGFVPYVTTPDLRTIHLEGNASTAVLLRLSEQERTM